MACDLVHIAAQAIMKEWVLLNKKHGNGATCRLHSRIRKKLSRTFHPDKDGSTQAMAFLNKHTETKTALDMFVQMFEWQERERNTERLRVETEETRRYWSYMTGVLQTPAEDASTAVEVAPPDEVAAVEVAPPDEVAAVEVAPPEEVAPAEAAAVFDLSFDELRARYGAATDDAERERLLVLLWVKMYSKRVRSYVRTNSYGQNVKARVPAFPDLWESLDALPPLCTDNRPRHARFMERTKHLPSSEKSRKDLLSHLNKAASVFPERIAGDRAAMIDFLLTSSPVAELPSPKRERASTKESAPCRRLTSAAADGSVDRRRRARL
jgi:hypothetical protein